MSIGLVLRRSIAVLARNLPAILVMSLLALAPVIAWAELAGYPVGGLKGGKANAAVIRFVVIAGVGCVLLSGLLAAAITPAALATLEGRRLSMLAALRAGTRAIGTSFGVAALGAAAIAAGVAAVVVPGLLLLGLLHVAVPAAVAERGANATTADEALRRGAALARRRWPGLLGLALAPTAIAGGLALGIARVVVPHVAAGRARVPAPTHWGNFVGLTLGLMVLFAAFSAVSAVVAYAALRDSDRSAPAA